MITKMKKLTFLIYHKDYECFLQNIRDLGVVHVAEKAQGTAENTELQESIRLSDHYASTIKFLQGFNVELQEQKGDTARGEKALEEVEALQLEKTQLQHQLQICDKERAALEVWGDFDPASVMRLQEVGYQVNFYICSEKNFNEEWLDTYYATEVNRIGSRIYFITITKEGTLPELEVESVKLPVMSLSRLAARCEDLEQQMKSVDDKLAAIAGEKLLSLQVAQANIRSQIEFSKVVLSTEQAADDKLMLLQGWAPATQIPELTDAQKAALEIIALEKERAGDTSTNWRKEDELFKVILKNYYIPELAKGELVDCKWTWNRNDNKNYCEVTYKDVAGDTQTVYLNYKLNDTRDDLVIFEKAEEVVSYDVKGTDGSLAFNINAENFPADKLQNDQDTAVYENNGVVYTIVNIGGQFYVVDSASKDVEVNNNNEYNSEQYETSGEKKTTYSVDENGKLVKTVKQNVSKITYTEAD